MTNLYSRSEGEKEKKNEEMKVGEGQSRRGEKGALGEDGWPCRPLGAL